MPLTNTQFDSIMREYNRKQLHSNRILEEHQTVIYTSIPEIKKIDEDIAACSLSKARALLENQAISDMDLEAQIQSLSARRHALLQEHGYPQDYLTLRHNCPICKDTGYIDSKKCVCFERAIIALLYQNSNLNQLLLKNRLQDFSFSYYAEHTTDPLVPFTPRQLAEQAYDTSQKFIKNFATDFENICYYGDTGVGKTFLSSCVAAALIEQGYSVLYFSAYELFEALADDTFFREQRQRQSNYIFECDLLIIDDLGTELTNSFVASQLFLCINERILHKKSTIISTNLDLEGLAETYSTRVFSRIFSHYKMIHLIGKDIRMQKELLGGSTHETK
ncbi:MAG: ATP-binding protein [Lachnospiraceae bacterium]